MNKINLLLLLLLSLGLSLITACGGGGSSGDSVPANYDISILGPTDNTALIGESVGLVLQLPESNITQIVWSQTSGPTIAFLAANRKVIGFDVPATGNYDFTVNFKDSGGGSRTANYSFIATDNAPVYINARLDHEANAKAKAKMTLIAYDNFPGTISNINWSQLSGPSATITNSDQLAIFFTAPNVSKDSLLQFKVTASDDQGNQASDLIYILIEPETINPDSHFTDGRFEANSLADVYPYNKNTLYADELVECIYSNTTTSYCDLNKLPFLGTQDPTPSVNAIMDRLLVSHDWMGKRFKEFLEQADTNNDIKNLLGATTSIVISYDIRPAFFWAGTGAIYLDAKYFWQTAQERDTLDIAPDFRSDFGNELQFVDPWRVIKNNDYAYYIPPIQLRETQTLAESKLYVLRVLYHELAHANDFFPPRIWNSASGSDYPWTYSESNQPDSTGLSNSFPLSSQQMVGLGGVLFQGETASTTEKNYTPTQVSDFFFNDNANNSYNYSTEREDYAMLAEEYLMSYRYGVQYDQGITGLAPDYIIATAERGRVGHNRIKQRAEYVVSRILPSIDIQTASSSLPQPILLESGISWFDAIVAPGQVKNAQKNKLNRVIKPIQFGRDFHRADELIIQQH